jgi:hypothetical protein
MKKILMICLMLIITLANLYSQDSRSLRAAQMSFRAAENKFRQGKYNEAAIDYEIVLQTISADHTSRKYLEMRMESLVRVIDIYFNRANDISKACDHLDHYFATMDHIRRTGILKASDLLEYQRLEKRYDKEYFPKCEAYKNLDHDMERFREKFEQEFE